MFASAKGKKKAGSTAAVVRYSVMIISHITFRDCRVHFFGDNLSRNSCIWTCTIHSFLFFWATHFGNRAFEDRVKLLESNVLNCCLRITTADLCKIGLQMWE